MSSSDTARTTATTTTARGARALTAGEEEPGQVHRGVVVPQCRGEAAAILSKGRGLCPTEGKGGGAIAVGNYRVAIEK